ncbi:MAG: hypothetical protein J6S27_02085 [Thermoguttaceae bacterium]|nr:hypothetical protein [Thermoguttaceae bacterium]
MSKKNKRYSASRLREIALMSSKGLPAELIAEIKGLPPKSVANICWVYKWSPEKLDEMTERGKLRGPKGDDARTCLRRYFIMHPEQRPAPHLQLFCEPKDAVESCQSDRPEMMREADRDFVSDLHRTLIEAGDVGRAPDLESWSLGRRVARLENLATCFRDDLDQLKIARENHDERLKNNHRRIEAFQRFIDEMPVLPAAKLEKSIGSLVAELASKDQQIDKLKDELAAQRRTLGLLSARVEALENHRQDLSWRVSKQEQNQTALLYNDSANKISAEQYRTLSNNIADLSERVEEIDRSVGATHNLYCSHASRICNIEKILKQDVIDGNAHERIDLLARCSGDHNKQLEELKAQAAKLEELLADVQESVNSIETNIEALREIE